MCVWYIIRDPINFNTRQITLAYIWVSFWLYYIIKVGIWFRLCSSILFIPTPIGHAVCLFSTVFRLWRDTLYFYVQYQFVQQFFKLYRNFDSIIDNSIHDIIIGIFSFLIQFHWNKNNLLTDGKDDSNRDSKRSRVSLSLRSSRFEKASSIFTASEIEWGRPEKDIYCKA